MVIKKMIEIFIFSVNEDIRNRVHEGTFAKPQLDIRKFSFSQRTVNEWTRLLADCVCASSVNV